MTSASEQTSDSKREPGWYWVRTQIDRFWIVRRFNAYGFWHDPHRNDVTDDEWSEIYEYRLPEPFAIGQPDELSKAEDVQLLKQQRIHDMNRISDLETTLKARPDKLSTYFELVQARRELSKAQERVKELEAALVQISQLCHPGLSSYDNIMTICANRLYKP